MGVVLDIVAVVPGVLGRHPVSMEVVVPGLECSTVVEASIVSEPHVVVTRGGTYASCASAGRQPLAELDRLVDIRTVVWELEQAVVVLWRQLLASGRPCRQHAFVPLALYRENDILCTFIVHILSMQLYVLYFF